MKEADNIQIILQEMIDYYAVHYKKENLRQICDKPSLMNGLGGVIYIQSLLYRYSDNKKIEKEIYKNIDKLINMVGSENLISYTFCDGISGIGWLFLYLNEKGIIKVDINDFLKEFDEGLMRAVKGLLLDENYDYLHGVIGVGIYFLKRKNKKAVTEIIDALYSNHRSTDGEICYKNKFFNGVTYYDFGHAHGNCGILHFLGKCYEAGISKDKCSVLIDGIVRFYFNNVQNFELTNSYFPYKIPMAEYDAKIPSKKFSRLAWCYGDLTILNTMIHISKWTNNTTLAQQAREMLRSTVKRINLENTLISDSCFCHGTSGVTYIYSVLYRETKDKNIFQIADFWNKKTLSNRLVEADSKAGKSHYNFNLEDTPPSPCADLLNGYGGVCVSILSRIKPEICKEASEIFMLS